MPVVTRKASLALDVLVVGGGIGGLAVAYVLSNSGHRVRVVEKHGLDAPGAGYRIPPNFSKILKQWVGEEALRRVATRCEGSPIYQLYTGERIGGLPYQEAVMKETGGEFLLMHRQDLVQMLYGLAIDSGATIDFHTEVVAISAGVHRNLTPRVVLRSGEVVNPDLLIGADGPGSFVRTTCIPDRCHVKPSGMVVYSAIVNMEDIRNAPEVGTGDGWDWPMWIGEYKALWGHPVGTSEFCMSLYTLESDSPTGSEAEWDEFPNTDHLADGMCPSAQRIIELPPRLLRQRFLELCEDGTCDWVDSSGRIVLLGDAAHPSIPGGTHTASLTVEDAVVLGSLLSHLRTIEQLPSLLNAYEELRHPRCHSVRLADIGHWRTLTLPLGPEADARDENMRHLPEEWDDVEALVAQFEGIASIFGYDAGDAAEEWWVNWGRLQNRVHERSSGGTGSGECISVSITCE